MRRVNSYVILLTSVSLFFVLGLICSILSAFGIIPWLVSLVFLAAFMLIGIVCSAISEAPTLVRYCIHLKEVGLSDNKDEVRRCKSFIREELKAFLIGMLIMSFTLLWHAAILTIDGVCDLCS